MDRQPGTSSASSARRRGAEILAAWRDAERRLAASSPQDAEGIRIQVVRLRAAYHAWMEATMDDEAGERAPRPEGDRTGSRR